MSFVLAIDPGIRSPGIALFSGGVLFHAARVSVPGWLKDADKSHGMRADEVGKLIATAAVSAARGHPDFPNALAVVYEWPQVYRATRSKGSPNDLLKTLATGAAAVAALRWYAVCATAVATPTPHDWAGNTKKATSGDPWDSERARMVARRLTADEIELVPRSHDAIDAVALGLWRVGRFDQIRVNAGASPG